MVIQAAKAAGGSANKEGYLYTKTPSSHGSYVTDSRAPDVVKTVNYIANSGLLYERFDDITYYG